MFVFSDSGIQPAHIISIVSAAVSSGLTIMNVVIACRQKKSDKTNLTIHQYQLIANPGGALHYFYHMKSDEFIKLIRLLRKKHAEVRKDDDGTFKDFEDNLGKLDEFAAGINAKLYNYHIFEILAFNYCCTTLLPKLKKILPLYEDDNSYANIRKLYERMDKERRRKGIELSVDDKVESELNPKLHPDDNITIKEILGTKED